MRWRAEFTAKAEKQFGKLDPHTQQSIVSTLDRILAGGDPRRAGKPLVGGLSGYWRYRVGKYRLICDIQDHRLIIEIISLGKRDSVYG